MVFFNRGLRIFLRLMFCSYFLVFAACAAEQPEEDIEAGDGGSGGGSNGGAGGGAPSLSYAGAIGTSGSVESEMSVSPTTLNNNGSAITSCDIKSGTTALPSGLSVHPTTCVISGTPSVPSATSTYTIRAGNAIGASADATVTLTVANAVYSVYNFESVNRLFSEGGVGGSSQSVTVQLTQSSSVDVVIPYSLSSVHTTAVSPADMDLVSGSITIPSGQTFGTIDFTYYGNSAPSSDKSIQLSLLSSGTGSPGTKAVTRLLARDDDGPSNQGQAVSALSVGAFNSCAVLDGGRLRCWGSNSGFQLGDGTSTDRWSAVAIDSASAYSMVSTGINHSCGVTTSGVLKCLGSNVDSQLGNGPGFNSSAVPVVIDSGTTYAVVSVGARHTCGVTSAGILKCWGDNAAGQLGTGALGEDQVSPFQIDSGTLYSSVSAGFNYTCGITTTGVLKCWGANNHGQLGNGSTLSQSTPVVVNPGVAYSSVSASIYILGTGSTSHTCGITTAGVLQCWGANSNGQLGIGSTSAQTLPTVVDSGVAYASVSAGHLFSCGITTTGALKCWGLNSGSDGSRNFFGRLGDATSVTQSTSPMVVDSGVRYAAVDTGGAHACGIIVSGALKCWGQNFFGQLGNGVSDSIATPAFIANANIVFSSTGEQKIEAGDSHACAISSTGALYCWGYSFQSQLGTGSAPIASSVPIRVDPGTSYLMVTGGLGHTCGITTSNDLKCWGLNSSGQLGDGGTVARTTPVAIDTSSKYVFVSAGSNHTCGITTSNVLKCWGLNSTSQLGDGSTASRHSPVAIDGSTTYAWVSAGQAHTCGVTSSGVLKCWGAGQSGRLGNGTSNLSVPTVIDSGINYSRVSAGNFHSCGITTTGQLRCWGSNSSRQVGNNSSLNQNTPVVIDSGVSYSSLSVGSDHSCAVTTAGVLKCWGGNTYLQIGAGQSGPTVPVPTVVDSGVSYERVSLGNMFTCGVTAGSSSVSRVKCWGSDLIGQGARGSLLLLPQPVAF